MIMQILVAEDDRRMAEVLSKTLTEEGHQVVIARDGREAFEIALYSPFDVIVLDVMLPIMSGTAWHASCAKLGIKRRS